MFGSHVFRSQPLSPGNFFCRINQIGSKRFRGECHGRANAFNGQTGVLRQNLLDCFSGGRQLVQDQFNGNPRLVPATTAFTIMTVGSLAFGTSIFRLATEPIDQ